MNNVKACNNMIYFWAILNDTFLIFSKTFDATDAISILIHSIVIWKTSK